MSRLKPFSHPRDRGAALARLGGGLGAFSSAGPRLFMSRPARSLPAERPLGPFVLVFASPLACPFAAVLNVLLSPPVLAILSSVASALASFPPTTHVRLSLVFACFWCSLD